MRIVFMGSPGFAVPSLVALAEAGHEIACVYSQPPRPSGRGKSDRHTAVHARAHALGIDVRTPKSLRDRDEQLRFQALQPDLAVVAAYGLILPKPILDAPAMGCVNVHASLLPRWRGAAPIQRAILAGDAVSGITIMRMDEGLDTGPILFERELSIDGKNAGQVTDELADLGAECLLQWIGNPSPAKPQPSAGATYASKIDKAETRISWTSPAVQIERQVRAFNPAPGAWFDIGGERFKLLEAQVVDQGGGAPGEVLDNHLSIACGAGIVRPLLIQRAGRAPMAPEALLRGFPIPRGSVLK